MSTFHSPCNEIPVGHGICLLGMPEIPEWANFIATDKNNFTFLYQYEPAVNGSHWMGARLKFWRFNAPYPCSNDSWKNTLVEIHDHIDPKYRREK